MRGNSSIVRHEVLRKMPRPSCADQNKSRTALLSPHPTGTCAASRPWESQRKSPDLPGTWVAARCPLGMSGPAAFKSFGAVSGPVEHRGVAEDSSEVQSFLQGSHLCMHAMMRSLASTEPRLRCSTKRWVTGPIPESLCIPEYSRKFGGSPKDSGMSVGLRGIWPISIRRMGSHVQVYHPGCNQRYVW
jgi:hypothetical protein